MALKEYRLLLLDVSYAAFFDVAAQNYACYHVLTSTNF